MALMDNERQELQKQLDQAGEQFSYHAREYGYAPTPDTKAYCLRWMIQHASVGANRRMDLIEKRLDLIERERENERSERR